MNHGLQHIAGVHRAFGRTRADDGVDLVDEGDDIKEQTKAVTAAATAVAASKRALEVNKTT